MRDPDEFDAFYKAARHRVLLQTYVLTGDLAAARAAVHDAFVAAWHHWRKVSRLDDPEDWVRPYAWHAAQRRHTARLGRRDRALDPDDEATFAALAKLTANQRRALVLDQLGETTDERMAREVGLPDEAFGRELALARATFPIHRGIEPDETGACLRRLGRRTEDARFPRPSIIRRAGAARRRTHTALGVAGAVAALVVATAVVGQPQGATPDLDGVTAAGQPVEEPPPPPLPVDRLLTGYAVSRVLGTEVGRPVTDDNTSGSGLHTVCQQEPFADPEGTAALVRRFSLPGRPPRAVRQAVDLSADESAAEQAYDTAVGWYNTCQAARVQLLDVYGVGRVGDEATLFVLRRWSRPVTTYAVGVARTGALTTQVVHQVEGDGRVRTGQAAGLLAAAVDGLCAHDDAGACSARPRVSATTPPPASDASGFLQVADLPPITRVDRPWVATPAERLRGPNPAATICDEADFRKAKASWAGTRTMVIPNAALPRSFGLSETIARFRTPAAAKSYLRTLERRMARCEDDDLSASLRALGARSTGAGRIATWHLETEIADDRTVEYRIALLRRGRDLAQVTFVPAPGAQMPDGGFQALAERALARLVHLHVRESAQQ